MPNRKKKIKNENIYSTCWKFYLEFHKVNSRTTLIPYNLGWSIFHHKWNRYRKLCGWYILFLIIMIIFSNHWKKLSLPYSNHFVKRAQIRSFFGSYLDTFHAVNVLIIIFLKSNPGKCHLLISSNENLTPSWRRPLSYRNQSIDWQSKSTDWFLYDNGLRHERVKGWNWWIWDWK